MRAWAGIPALVRLPFGTQAARAADRILFDTSKAIPAPPNRCSSADRRICRGRRNFTAAKRPS